MALDRRETPEPALIVFSFLLLLPFLLFRLARFLVFIIVFPLVPLLLDYGPRGDPLENIEVIEEELEAIVLLIGAAGAHRERISHDFCLHF